ncbi:MAG: hypothetical protein D3908_05135 [Candidatus Electrothrix sp. AUS4]|nr:hypothetical protein [Candidatus Electrothrix sp. AUS4]
MSNFSWIQQGKTLSHKNACKEFGLTEVEIINAIKAEEIQYKINYAHGNPYYKLLRDEIEDLAIRLHGKSHFEKQELEYKVKKITREINTHKRKVKALENEKATLTKELDLLIHPELALQDK